MKPATDRLDRLLAARDILAQALPGAEGAGLAALTREYRLLLETIAELQAGEVRNDVIDQLAARRGTKTAYRAAR